MFAGMGVAEPAAPTHTASPTAEVGAHANFDVIGDSAILGRSACGPDR
jgi:hypothetical protein